MTTPIPCTELEPADTTRKPQDLPLVVESKAALQPLDVFRRLAPLPGLLFLDSARHDAVLGRYSYLTADPFETIRSRGGNIQITNAGRETASLVGDPLQVLAQRLARYRQPTAPAGPLFQGGAAGLLSYDLCHHIERLPRPRFDEFTVPDLAVGLYDWVLAFDHAEHRSWIVSTGLPEREPSQRQDRARQRLDWLRTVLDGTGDSTSHLPAHTDHATTASPQPPNSLAPQYPLPGHTYVTSNFSPDGYVAAVRRAIEYIRAGDVFQVNLAQRLLTPAETLSPADLYERLRLRNPAPMAAYADLGDFVIASASPERFLTVRQGEVETRPIKGTRPRGVTVEEDLYRCEELRCSPKDRAENIMIVDLLRNDLGRVCRYGSINVAELCRVETFEFVHHLVSVVRGRLRDHLGPLDLVRAAFPGGSVTGAPKVRAIEIIAELEPTARGAYCGSLGFIGFDGSMDLNLLIRTFTLGRGWIQFPVGGGIVADSDPHREYAETLHKAEGLMRALL